MNSGGTPVGAFNGIMDEARIWNTIRSEAQIQAAMTGPLASAPGMVARWSMDEGTGGTIASSAGTTVNGTLTNGPLFVTGTPFVSTANTPPNVPTNVAPTNGATGVSVNPTLQVGVSDPNGGTLTTSFYGRTAGSSAAEDFTIVVIPDTQHYVDSDADFMTFNQQTQWIVNNEDDLNIVFVSQLGDITEHFDTVRQEFDRADAAMDILDNAGIPNNLAPGNHDMSKPGAVTSDLWDEYFPPGRYNLPVNPWYGGWLGEEAGQVQRLNKDNYELFTAGGIDFLIIHLEIDMPTYAVQWADEIIDRYPDRQVILSTHAFVNTSNARPSSRVTTRADGLSAAQVWTQLVAPNCNVFMVVNGHYPGEGRLTSTNSCGQPVHQVLTDYQSRANGGDGWLRYYTFRPCHEHDRRVGRIRPSSARSRTTRPVSSPGVRHDRAGRLRPHRDGGDHLRLHRLDAVAGPSAEHGLRVVRRDERRHRGSHEPDLDVHDRERPEQQPAGRHRRAEPDQRRRRRHRPDGLGDRPGERHAHVRRERAAGRTHDEPDDRSHHRHDRVHRGCGQPIQRHGHRG